ncbi:hypothetical protein D9M70_494400 [compost metagenome]
MLVSLAQGAVEVFAGKRLQRQAPADEALHLSQRGQLYRRAVAEVQLASLGEQHHAMALGETEGQTAQ